MKSRTPSPELIGERLEVLLAAIRRLPRGSEGRRKLEDEADRLESLLDELSSKAA